MKSLFLIVAALITVGCAAAPGGPGAFSSAGASSAAGVLALPDDVARFQSVQRATAADLAQVSVTEDAARASAKAAGAIWSGGEAYVGRLSGFAVSNRLVWVLRYPGISVVGPDPGVGSPPPPFNVAFYFVDAQSGAAVGATMATE